MNQPLFGGFSHSILVLPLSFCFCLVQNSGGTPVRDNPRHESWDCCLAIHQCVRKWGTVFMPWNFQPSTRYFFAGGTFFQAAAGLCNGRQVDTEVRSLQLWLGRSKPKRISDGKLGQPVTREFCATKHVKTQVNINVIDIEPRNLTPKSLAYITYIGVSLKIWYL